MTRSHGGFLSAFPKREWASLNLCSGISCQLFVHPTQIINISGWHLKIIIYTALPQLPRWRQKLGKEPLHIQHLLKEWNIVLCVIVVSWILGIQQQFLLTLRSTLATCTWTQSSSAFPSFLTLLEKLCCLLVWHAKGQELLLGGWIWLGQCPLFFFKGHQHSCSFTAKCPGPKPACGDKWVGCAKHGVSL